MKKPVDSVMTIGELGEVSAGELAALAKLTASWKSAIENAINPLECSARWVVILVLGDVPRWRTVHAARLRFAGSYCVFFSKTHRPGRR